MDRLTERPLRILGVALLAASAVFGQAYTISAKPGVVNYIEGTAFWNGNPLSEKNLKNVALSANDTFSTEKGKAEILLTPGVFLRLAEDTEIRMVSPSLTDTKVEISRGEVMIEASGLTKENNLQILDHGAIINVPKNGLYKFTADNPPTAAVLDGKLAVAYDERHVGLKKGREVILASNLPVEKFDTKRDDDLYAWSNVRSQYEAASSYSVARGALSGGYGYGASSFGPGWYWDSGFSSYAWLPASGAFYSPFGYGFFSPGYVGSAAIISTSVYRGGQPWRYGRGTRSFTGGGVTAAVPVSPNNPPSIGGVASSPWADHRARVEAARAYAAANGGSFAGFNSANGAAGAGQHHWNGNPGSGNPGGWHGNAAGGGGGWHGNGAGAGGGGWHGGAGAGSAGAGAHMGGGGGGAAAHSGGGRR